MNKETTFVKSEWTVEQAQQDLLRHLVQHPYQTDGEIIHTPDLDIGTWYAFTVRVRPESDASGFRYMVSPDEILAPTAGWDNNFDTLMANLNVGSDPHAIEFNKFANLFIYLRLRKPGRVITGPDDRTISWVDPEDRPDETVTVPQITHSQEGTHYRFWTWDAVYNSLLHLDVLVTPDGTTTYEQLYP